MMILADEQAWEELKEMLTHAETIHFEQKPGAQEYWEQLSLEVAEAFED